MTDLLTAAEAARRLGVEPATLHAYVSRGTLSRKRSADGRTSLFDADEIEALTQRGCPRRPAGVLDITVESEITEIAGTVCGTAGMMWSNWRRHCRWKKWGSCCGPARFRAVAPEAALAVGRGVQSVLPRRPAAAGADTSPALTSRSHVRESARHDTGLRRGDLRRRAHGGLDRARA